MTYAQRLMLCSKCFYNIFKTFVLIVNVSHLINVFKMFLGFLQNIFLISFKHSEGILKNDILLTFWRHVLILLLD